MGTTFVVPNKEGIDFLTEVRSPLRNQDLSSAFVFQGPNEALDHGDAAVLPSGTVSWMDAIYSTPALEFLAPEDAVLVTDQILGLGCSGPAILALYPIARNALPLKLLCCLLSSKEAE